MNRPTVGANRGVPGSVSEHQPNGPYPRPHYPQPPQYSEQVFGHGTLHVEIYQARGIKGDEINGFGKADPYLIVKHGVAHRRVKLLSPPHRDAGSDPVWNREFSFPMRNGGTKDHNILEIEIMNDNSHTHLFRGDNSLGNLRIGGLAEWVTRQPHYITEPAWYPVFYKHRRSSKDQEYDRGEILMKFYFEVVNPQVFALEHRAEPSTREIAGLSSAHYQPARYRRVEGNKFSSVFGTAGVLLGIAQTVIMLL